MIAGRGGRRAAVGPGVDAGSLASSASRRVTGRGRRRNPVRRVAKPAAPGATRGTDRPHPAACGVTRGANRPAVGSASSPSPRIGGAPVVVHEWLHPSDCRKDGTAAGDPWRSLPRRVLATVAVAVLAAGTPTAEAGEPPGVSRGSLSILVLAPSADDDRVAPFREAIGYWNHRLAELGVATRFAEPGVAVESPVERALENYARQVAQRATRLPAGDSEPPAPAALVDLDADVVLLLSRQDILSFTWPLPRVSPRRYLVVIRRVRGPYRTDPMVTKHVVAHELGHALGLDHNAEPHTLMCGPCQPLTAEPDATGFLPLTAGDRARLVELHGR